MPRACRCLIMQIASNPRFRCGEMAFIAATTAPNTDHSGCKEPAWDTRSPVLPLH
jgi:hypothetical protein